MAMQCWGFKVIKRRDITDHTDDHGLNESHTELVTIAAPPRMDIRLLKERIEDEFNTHCQHSYDCCGHWYSTAYTHTLRRNKSGEYRFVKETRWTKQATCGSRIAHRKFCVNCRNTESW